MTRFGPKIADHPSVGTNCPACRQPFVAGDYTTLVAIGPGPDEEARAKARMGHAYNAVAVEAHWSCVTDEPDPHSQDVADTGSNGPGGAAR